jgi:hypothetical protein
MDQTEPLRKRLLEIRKAAESSANPTRLDQILTNLCVNARDATADGGKVASQTQHIVLEEEYCASHACVVKRSLNISGRSRNASNFWTDLIDFPVIVPIVETVSTTASSSRSRSLSKRMVFSSSCRQIGQTGCGDKRGRRAGRIRYAGGSSRKTGRKTRKSLPRSGSLATVATPLCALTMPHTVASPIPRPANLLEKNGSKIFSISSGAIPPPVSVTPMQT